MKSINIIYVARSTHLKISYYLIIYVSMSLTTLEIDSKDESSVIFKLTTVSKAYSILDKIKLNFYTTNDTKGRKERSIYVQKDDAKKVSKGERSWIQYFI